MIINSLKAVVNNRDLIKNDGYFEEIIDAVSKEGVLPERAFNMFNSPSDIVPYIPDDSGEYRAMMWGDLHVENLISWYDWKKTVHPYLERYRERYGNQDFNQDYLLKDVTFAITTKGSNARNPKRRKSVTRRRRPKGSDK